MIAAKKDSKTDFGGIALFLPCLAGGGVARVVLNLAAELARRGLPVEVVVLRAFGDGLRWRPGNVPLAALQARQAPPPRSAVLTGLPALFRYLRRRRPALLVSTTPFASIMALLIRNLWLRQLPVVARYDYSFSLAFSSLGFKGRMKLRLARRLWRSAEAVVAVSQGAADDLKRHAPGIAHRVRHIPNPVASPGQAQEAGGQALHPWLGSADAPVILSVGRLAPQKSHATLLRAFAELLRFRPARLLILGEGWERRRLTDLAQCLGIAHLVDFPGFCANPYAFMEKASLFVLSSIGEGCPMVLVEAMACGTPVVSTDCPNGPREILEGGKWGRLVPMNDAPALAKAMLETLDDPMQPDLLKTRASAYSVSASADQYMQLFGEICPALGQRPPSQRLRVSGSGSLFQ